MKVLELHPARRVLWQVVEGPAGVDRHQISWDLKQEGDYAIVLFKHQGWKEPVEFMHHCSTKWAIFLMSLKSLVETGKGAPARRHQDRQLELGSSCASGVVSVPRSAPTKRVTLVLTVRRRWNLSCESSTNTQQGDCHDARSL